MPLRQIITLLTVFFLSFHLFGQSEQNIQFETFYQEKETSNSELEEFEGPVLFHEKKPERSQVEDLDSEAYKASHFETEARFEKVLNTGIKEKNITEAITEIDYRNPENFQQNSRTHKFSAVKNNHGVLSYRNENGTWGWYDFGDEENDGKYVGDIVNMKPNGSGIFVYGKGKWEGETYNGQWRDGEFHGKGTYTRTNGERFFGEWKKSMLWNITGYNKYGRIIKKYRRGEQLIIVNKDVKEKKNTLEKRKRGTLFREVPLSKWELGGKKWMTEGDRKIHGVFEGEILNGVPDGEGSYSWYDVEKYVGEFKRGVFHGNGKFTYLSGITAEGVFRKNKEWDTLRTEENGEVIGKFVKGRYYPLKTLKENHSLK